MKCNDNCQNVGVCARNNLVTLKRSSLKPLVFLCFRKGSRLKKSKANLADAGTYECIIKNVYGEIKQASVISITGGKLFFPFLSFLK